MSQDRLVPMLLNIGVAIEKQKKASSKQKKYSEAKNISLMEEIKESATHALPILEIAEEVENRNRTLIGAYVELGKGMGLFVTQPRGRAVLVKETPLFVYWKHLARGDFEKIAELVEKLGDKLETGSDEEEKDVKRHLFELKKTFQLLQVFSQDPLAERRYEILGDDISKALIGEKKEDAIKIVEEVANKLRLMQEMWGTLTEGIPEGI